MKRKRLILVIIMTLLLSGISLVGAEQTSKEEVGEYDFRNVRWGMSKEEVIMQEGTPDERNEDMLIYKIEISGVSLGLKYKFIDDVLVEALFGNIEKYISTGSYYDDYQTIKKALTAVYGPPNRDIARWDDSLFKAAYSEKMGFQLAVVSFMTEWSTDHTLIQHILRSKEMLDATHAFKYQSLISEHQELIKKKEQAELERAL